MKLGEIIRTNNWMSVELTLLKLYPDQDENIKTYKRIYSLLQERSPQESSIEIVIEQEFDEETQKPGVPNVYGIDHESKDEITNSVALEYTAWNKWMGMEISKFTQKEFTELEIISHCLYEMTFVGYDEDEIQAAFSSIKNIYEAYNGLSIEEKKLKTKSLEDILKDLDQED